MDTRSDQTPTEHDLPQLADRTDRRRKARTAELPPIINERQVRVALQQTSIPPSLRRRSRIACALFFTALGFVLGTLFSLLY